jgi:molybdenum cofactor guanylyltransferase
MIARADITGVILCGGDARRMSGVEKPLQPLGDAPLVAHVHDRLAPQVMRVVISANRSLDRFAAWGDPVVPDMAPGQGPLGGLLSVLEAIRESDTPYLFACPGDAPFLDRALVSRLAQALDDADADIAEPHDGTRAQHLFLLMRTTTRPSIASYLDRGERSVHGWLDTQRVITVNASDIAASFANINTPQELQDAHSPFEHTHFQQHREHL